MGEPSVAGYPYRLIGSFGELALSGGRGPLAEVVELYGVRYGVHGTGARIIGGIFDIATVMAGRCIRSILSGLGSREGDCAQCPLPTRLLVTLIYLLDEFGLAAGARKKRTEDDSAKRVT